MKRFIASVLIGFIGLIYSIPGGFMRGFGSDDPFPYYQALLAFLWTLLTVSSLWMSSRILLLIAGLLMLPMVALGIYWIMIPVVGVGMLLLCALWYAAAYSRWKTVSRPA
jgi:hypothetical protein